MGGLVGPLVFIISYTIQGLFKEGYSALRYPISSLAIGETGWVQVSTFIISGLLILLFAVTVNHKINNNLIVVLYTLVGTGLIAAGIFTTDPVFGFPQNMPFIKNQFTLHGKLHTWFSLLVFLGIPIICFLTGKYFSAMQERRWKYYSIATAIFMLFLFLLTGVAFNQLWGLGPVAGLLQRLCVLTGFVWISLFALKLRSLK